MPEMPGVFGELCPLPLGGIGGMEGLLQLRGGDGLAQGEIQIPVEQPFMGFLEVDGLPGSMHGSAPISVQCHEPRSFKHPKIHGVILMIVIKITTYRLLL
jgi:hypothetical protein